ncbi:IPT/TIG domain-containing protein [Streptomyces sp. NPDC054933]
MEASAAGGLALTPSVSALALTAIPAGTSPFAVAIAPNGRVFVANATSNNVTVIDSATDTVLTTVPVGSYPIAVAVAASGGVYVANTGSNNVTVIDSATNTVVTTVPAGTSPFAVAVAPNGRVYVPNNQSNNVTVIDSATNTALTSLAVGSGPEAAAVAPDGKVYVTSAPNSGPDQVYFSTNDGGVFRVGYRPFNFPDSQQAVTAGSVTLNVNATGYADSGVVLESFKLGDIDQATVAGTGPLTVNLWFDTNNDGRYFIGLTPTGTFQAAGGDDYGNLQGTNVEFFTDSHGTVSLADLKAGAVPGITANTNVALWVGISQNASASITTVNGQNVVDYIHGSGPGQVTVIDSTTDTVLATLAADNGTWAAAVAPNGKMYAANSAASDISVFAPYPTLTGISPASGPTPGGNPVVITGTNFTTVTSVTFDDNSATFTVDSDSQITATAPAHGRGPVTVTVTNPDGSATTTYTYTPGLALSRNQGGQGGGTTVDIYGTGLTGTTAVMFGTKPATSFTQVSPTHVQAVSPSGTGEVGVTLTTPGGTSSPVPFYYLNPPNATGAAPASGPLAGGTTVTITGANLAPATAVTFGATAGTITANTASSITATTPAAATPGTAPITVTTPGGSSSNSLTFTYATAPTITAVTPSAGSTIGGDPVTITGAGLGSTGQVTFDGLPAGFHADSDSLLVASAPPHAAGTVNVVITSAGGSVTAVGAFTYQPPPVS